MNLFAANAQKPVLQMNSKLTSKGSGRKLASVILENALWNSTTGRVLLCFFKTGIDQ
jgi:hypothetical protein